MRTCGVHAHRLPEYPRLGITKDANEVGVPGEMKRLSWPTTIEVRSQSKCMLAVRNRTSPVLMPSSAPEGKPPPKSNWTSPLVFAPNSSGPKTSSPSSDWRNVAPKEEFVPYALPAAA